MSTRKRTQGPEAPPRRSKGTRRERPAGAATAPERVDGPPAPEEVQGLLDVARDAERPVAVAQHRLALDLLVALWVGASWRCRAADLPQPVLPLAGPSADLRPLLVRLLADLEARPCVPPGDLLLQAVAGDSPHGAWIRQGTSPARDDLVAWQGLVTSWLEAAAPLLSTWPLATSVDGCHLGAPGRDLPLRPFLQPSLEGGLLVAVGAWGPFELACRSTRGGPLHLVPLPPAFRTEPGTPDLGVPECEGGEEALPLPQAATVPGAVWSLHEACRRRGLPVPPDPVLRDLATRVPSAARLVEEWLRACRDAAGAPIRLVLQETSQGLPPSRLLEGVRLPEGVELVVRTPVDRASGHPSGALLEPVPDAPVLVPEVLERLRGLFGGARLRELPLALLHGLATLEEAVPERAILEWHGCDPDLPEALQAMLPVLLRGTEGGLALRLRDRLHVRAEDPQEIRKAACRLATWAMGRLLAVGVEALAADDVDPAFDLARRHLLDWVEASGREDLRDRVMPVSVLGSRLLESLRRPGRLDWRLHVHARAQALFDDPICLRLGLELAERMGDLRSAAASLDALIPRLLAGSGRDRPEAARLLLRRAEIRLRTGRPFQTLEDCGAAEALEQECGGGLPQSELAWLRGQACAAAGQPRQALELLLGARALAEPGSPRWFQCTRAIAELYALEERDDEARFLLDEALHRLEGAPGDEEARLLAQRAALEPDLPACRGLWERALARWSELVQSGRRDLRPDLALALHRSAAASADPDEALEAAIELGRDLHREGLHAETAPELARAMVSRARRRVEEGDPARAGADLDEALSLWQDLVERQNRTEHRPDLAATLTSRGTVRAWEGDLEGALREHERALAEYQGLSERAPEEFRLDLGLSYFNRGGTYKRLGDLELARRDYDRAVALLEQAGDDEALAAACANRGRTQAEAGRLEEARQDFDRALACWGAEPVQESARARGWRADALARLGDVEGALQDYRRASRDLVRTGAGAGEIADLLIDEARIARAAGHTQDAISVLEQALSVGSDRPEIWGDLSSLAAEAGDARRAIHEAGEALLRADAEHPRRGEWLYRRGRLRRVLGDAEGAAADLSEAAFLVCAEERFEVLMQSSGALAECQRWGEALAAAEDALVSVPELRGQAGCLAFLARGLALEALGQLPESLADYSRAVEHGSEHAEGEVGTEAMELLASAYLGRLRVQLDLDPVPDEAESDAGWALDLLQELVHRQGRAHRQALLDEALLLRARLAHLRGDAQALGESLDRLLTQPRHENSAERPPRTLLLQLRRLGQEGPHLEALDRVRALLDPMALEESGPVGEQEWLELLDARARSSLDSGSGNEVLGGYDRLLRACEDLLGARGPLPALLEKAAVAYNNRGTLKARSGRVEEALADYALSLERYGALEATRPDPDVWLEMARLRLNRAAVYRMGGRLDESIGDLEGAADLRRRAMTALPGPEHARRLAQALRSLAQVLLEQGRPEPAQEALSEALEVLVDSNDGEDLDLRALCHVLRASSLEGRSRSSWALGDLQEAARLYEELLGREDGPCGPEDLAGVLGRVADLLESLGRPCAAAEALQRAIEVLGGEEPTEGDGSLLQDLLDQMSRLNCEPLVP